MGSEVRRVEEGEGADGGGRLWRPKHLREGARELGGEEAEVVDAEGLADERAVEGRRERQVDEAAVEQRLGDEAPHEAEELQRALGHLVAARLRHRAREEAVRRVHKRPPVGAAALRRRRRRRAVAVAVAVGHRGVGRRLRRVVGAP